MTKPEHAYSDGDGRSYRHPRKGKTVPSATTVISVIDKPVLKFWAAKTVAQYAVDNWDTLAQLGGVERVDLMKRAPWRTSEAAAGLGDDIHAAVEAYSLGEATPEVSDKARPYVTQFEKFLDSYRPKFLESEITVWNDRFGYAGTADWIAEIDGKTVLGDTKTGKGVYSEVALQLDALRHGEFILRADGREDPMPHIDDLAVLHLRPRSWSLIPVTFVDTP